MTDIERAKTRLAANGHTVVLVKGDREITSFEHGVAPLMQLVARGESVQGFSAADKIVGRAAALLYAHLGVKEVYAEVLSEGAKSVLETHGIVCSCGVLTDKIVNRAGDDICPMERAVSATDSPEEAIRLLRAAIARMRAAKN